MKYTLVVEETANNHAAYVADLPGCTATAKTREALFEEIREAIEFHLEGIREDGEPVPEPRAMEQTVTLCCAPPSSSGRGSGCWKGKTK